MKLTPTKMLSDIKIGDEITVNHPNYKKRKFVVTFVNMTAKTVTVRGIEDVNAIRTLKVPFKLIQL
jgi:hypothetical protein